MSIAFKSRTGEPFYGDKVTMVAESLLTPDIEWFHVKELEDTKRKLDFKKEKYIESTNEEHRSTFVISEVRSEDAGLYYISSKAGQRLSNRLSLKVKGGISN